MLKLSKSLAAWGTDGFEGMLKQELAQHMEQLPLQQGLATGNYVADAPLTVVINSCAELDHLIRVRAGIFYYGVIGGCSCEDDPTPASEINEYCEVQLEIAKVSAATTVQLLAG